MHARLVALAALVAIVAPGIALAHVGGPAAGSATQLAQLRRTSGETRKLDAALARFGVRAPKRRALVVVRPSAGMAAARRAVRRAGGTVEVVSAGLLEARVPGGALRRLSRDRAVARLRSPARPVPLAVRDEGVDVTGATQWHNAGLTGKGVRVAVIDVGFGGLSLAQGTGRVTPNATKVDLCSGQIDVEVHGTAVAEVVSAQAPDAQLFLLCVDSEVSLDAAEKYAKANGAQIITMSLGWYGTWSGDGRGPIGTPDATVADARAAGILWVNSAGNDAVTHWEGAFVDTNANNVAEFPSGDETNSLTIPGRNLVCVFLRWNEWPHATHDYDLVLYREVAPLRVLASSTDDQHDLHTEPREQVCYTNLAVGPIAAGIEVVKEGADTNPPPFELFAEAVPSPVRLQYAVAAGSVTDPATAPGALAVGAACWRNDGVEFYSSLGPTIDGRLKPDFVAPDSVSTGTYGQSTQCGDGFAGTSAAAPHVAGAAALVKERYPSFSAAQLSAYLTANAHDLGPPGPDTAYGAGLVQLPAIVAPVVQTPTVAGVGARRARVAVTVAPRASDTKVKFEYGTSGLTTSTAYLTAPADRSSVKLSLQLAGLRPATTYRVRAVASSIGGTATSAVRTFRTTRR